MIIGHSPRHFHPGQFRRTFSPPTFGKGGHSLSFWQQGGGNVRLSLKLEKNARESYIRSHWVKSGWVGWKTKLFNFVFAWWIMQKKMQFKVPAFAHHRVITVTGIFNSDFLKASDSLHQITFIRIQWCSRFLLITSNFSKLKICVAITHKENIF